jgi:hypothetical protein
MPVKLKKSVFFSKLAKIILLCVNAIFKRSHEAENSAQTLRFALLIEGQRKNRSRKPDPDPRNPTKYDPYQPGIFHEQGGVRANPGDT